MKSSITLSEVFPGPQKTLLMSLVLGLFLIPAFGFAYDYETHGFLTKQTTEFYNTNFSEKVPQNLLDFLVDGSRREDDAPRWVNHFYDPVYQRGYQPDITIDSYPLVFAGALEKVVNWVSSKQWADSSSEQNRLVYKATAGVYRIASILSAGDKTKLNINSETDFSWETAKQYWLRGEKEKAMFALGHVLHLIQDASVPDHTRNDGHIGDSVYEKWTSKFNLRNSDVQLSNRLVGKTPVELSNLGDYFESIAKYSNNNFYSGDTVGLLGIYKNPEIENVVLRNGRYYGMKFDEQKNEQLLLFYKKFSGSIVLGSKNDISLNDPYDLVMQDYWSRLSPKAVQHGAGVINLFLEEVKNEQLKEQESPWYQQLWQWLVQQRDSLLGGQVLPGGGVAQNDQSQENQNSGEVPQLSPDSTSSPQTTPEIISPTPSPAISVFPSISLDLRAGGSPTPLVSLVPSLSLSLASSPQFMSAQTPNNPTPPEPTPQSSPSPEPIPTPEASPESTPEPSPTPESSPSPSPEFSPSPTPSPEISPSPEPSPSPTPDYQDSNNKFFDNVAWYFDTEAEPDKGGVLTIEMTVSELLPGSDYHAIVAGWNSDFVLTDGEKEQGGKQPLLKYNITTSTALMINELDENYGPANSLWNLNGDPLATSSGQFPKNLKIAPTSMRTTNYQFLEKDTEEGITKIALEQKLGRKIGDDDFITLAYWPLYNYPAQLDNVHYLGSFIEHDSDPVVYPEPRPVNQIKQLRWGVDSSSETGYSVEFEYVMPIQEVSDQYSYGTEIRFHLNSQAGFYYDRDPNLQTQWFHGNGPQNLIYLNYGFLGSDTCDSWAKSEPKNGMRFVYDSCGLDSFRRMAYQFNHLPHQEHPTSSSWIIKLPILSVNAPKPLFEMNLEDYLTISLWGYETGQNTGLYLRQIDSRKFYFKNAYQALTPIVSPPPEPSRQVVINEIAWMGTATSTNDEWLELYNNSDTEVDFVGWILRSVSDSPKINLSEIIPAGGYYLLERTDDNVVSDITANLTFKGVINNDCEVLELIDDSDNVVDRTACNISDWPAGDNTTKSSMERINPDVSGEDLSNWQTNNGVVKNGHDAGGSEIFGTPKQKNSASP